MDRSLTFLNSEIEQLKSRVNENEAAMKSLNSRHSLSRCLLPTRESTFLQHSWVYQHDGGERWGTYLSFYETGAFKVENARDIEFQRVHRIGGKKPDSPRPIIARFLWFPDREKVFKRELELKDEIDVKLYADYPREIQERRRKLWPRLRRAREEGKRAFFDKKEPDKLIIDGHMAT